MNEPREVEYSILLTRFVNTAWETMRRLYPGATLEARKLQLKRFLRQASDRIDEDPDLK